MNNPSKVGYRLENSKRPLLPIFPKSVQATGPITASFGSNRLNAAILNNSSGFAKASAKTKLTPMPNCRNSPKTPTSNNITKKNHIKNAVKIAVSCF